MRYFHKTMNKFHCPTLNLDRIWALVGEEVRSKYAKANPAKDEVPVIDLGEHVTSS